MTYKNIIGVFGLPVRKDGKVLLTQRYAPKNPKYHLKWQLPGGGMDHGESPQQTLYREIMEELHAKSDILFPYPIVTTRTTSNAHFVFLSYIIKIHDEPDLSHDPDWETADARWFTKQETNGLPQLPGVGEILDQAFKIIDENDILASC